MSGKSKHTVLTKSELAKALKISIRTVERMMDDGLPMLKGGAFIRFEYSKVIDWMSENSKKIKKENGENESCKSIS